LSEPPEKPRKLRADSQRNREQLLAAAKAAFAASGAETPLEDIARRAGVGIGTLYRHFPSRDALLAAVSRREVEHLAASAARLLDERPAGEALEAWLHLLVDYMATKRVIAPALQASVGEGAEAYASGGAAVSESMNRLLEAAIAAGAVRPDIGPQDLFRAMIGFSYGYEQPDWEASARRLISVLMGGLRG